MRDSRATLSKVRQRMGHGDAMYQFGKYEDARKEYESARHMLTELRKFDERVQPSDPERAAEFETHAAAIEVRTKLAHIALSLED